MKNEKYAKQDEQLFYHIQKLQQGDTASYGEIYNLSGKYIYKIIYDIVQDYHTTEDMLQETFIKIYNNIGSLKSPEAYYVWAGRIATNLCIRHLQKYRKEMLQAATDDGEGNETFIFDTVAEDNENFIPESVMDNKEHQRLIAKVIDGLSPEQKLAVQCFYFEEMSVKEIADLMGCSTGTVKSRLNYARKSIKEAVLDIEKKDGTKLYSLGAMPILLLLFRMEAEAAVGASATAAVGAALSGQVSTMGSGAAAAGVTATVASETATVATSAVTSAATSVATTATVATAKAISAKVVALIVAATLSVGAGAAYFVMNKNDDKKKDKDNDTKITWQDKLGADEDDYEIGENGEAIRLVDLSKYISIEWENPYNGYGKPILKIDEEKLDKIISPEAIGSFIKGYFKGEYEAGNMGKDEYEVSCDRIDEIVNNPDSDMYPGFIRFFDIYLADPYMENVSNGDIINVSVRVDTDDGFMTVFDKSYYGNSEDGLAGMLGIKIVKFDLEIVATGLIETEETTGEEDSSDDENASSDYIVPEGGRYIVGSTGEELQAGDRMPKETQSGDSYYYGDYRYVSRGDHWLVEMNVEDYESRTSFGEILSNIAGEDVEDISGLFYDCKSMIDSPEIPATVTDIDFAYAYCESLVKAPAIPDGVYTMINTYVNCTNMVEAADIPDGVLNMTSTFERCSSLKVAPKLPSGIANLQSTFFECSSLEEAPELPSGVKSLNFTFAHCFSLKKAPVIPEGVESMGRTFAACNSLEQAPEIPASVKDMTGTFYNCTGLRGTVVIHANPTEYEECFTVYDFDALGLEFGGTSTMLDALKATGYVNK